MNRQERKAAVQRLRKADAALHANQRREIKAGVTTETPEYLRLNGEANKAAVEVSWWRGGNRRNRKEG